MTQTVIETMRGLRICIDPSAAALSEIQVIKNLLALIIHDEKTKPAVAASLRYARVHVIQAISHQAKEVQS